MAKNLLLQPDSPNWTTAFRTFAMSFRKATKKTIYVVIETTVFRVRIHSFEFLHTTFLRSSEGYDLSFIATALLSKLKKKLRYHCFKPVSSIKFSHSSRKALSKLKNFSCRSRHSPGHVSPDAIASVVLNNPIGKVGPS